MRTRLALVLAAASAALVAEPASAEPPTSLEVRLQGVQQRPGLMLCALYREPRGFPAESAHAARITIGTGTGAARTCAFEGIAPGRWAVAALHDENGNYRLDTNLLGMPTEGWGTSRDVTHRLRAPSFEESVIDLPAGKQSTTLHLHY